MTDMDVEMEMVLDGPGMGEAGAAAYRHRGASRGEQAMEEAAHPATIGYNEFTEGQRLAQGQRRRPRARQQRASSMQHVRPQHMAAQQQERRGSMSEAEQTQRRQAIKAILADRTLPEVERRKSIQALMDGRRNSMGSHASCGSAGCAGSAGSCSPVSAAAGPCTAGLCQPVPAGPSSPPPQVVLAGYKMGSHPYTASTTPVPAVAAQAPYVQQHCTEHSKRLELSRPACEHYNRNCTIIAPCCGAAFGCRICHDDCPVLPPLLQDPSAPSAPAARHSCADSRGAGGRHPRSSSMPVSMASFNEPQHHTIDRFAIKEVICRKCYTRQSSKTNNCINCGIQFGEYHCAICNLWMDSAERPYHCADCGFCRVGGAENFRHCQDCGMCIDASLFAQHNCKVGKYMQNCPICQEDLFSSRSASHEMPCGHAIHWHCFRELAAHDSRCPVCKKTAETHERMQPTWNAMAMGIELQPVPPDLAKAVTIMCNDCERTDEDRAWHFLGVQCRSCTSFNTVVERITRVGADAHAFLSRVDPHPSQRQAAVEAEAARVQHGQQQQHQQQEHEQGQQPLPPDEMVPSDEQERLFR